MSRGPLAEAAPPEEVGSSQERLARMAAFGQLAAGITHEVKNPITGIISFAQIAQKKLEDKEQVRELLRLIEQEGLRCRSILSDFLNLARSDASAPARALRLNLDELVRRAAPLFAHQLSVTQVQVELELCGALPEVLGSPNELIQVLLNLAINAQQAMPQGGTVQIRTRPGKDGGASLSVADDGPGIPQEHLPRLFEPFFTTKPVGQGTGLGLAICARILADHGGTIAVESSPGEGATFTLWLPAAESKEGGR